MAKILHTADDVRAHAESMELRGMDFLDAAGNIGARYSRVKKVRVKFIDGATGVLPVKVFEEQLGDVRFKLRKTQNDS